MDKNDWFECPSCSGDGYKPQTIYGLRMTCTTCYGTGIADILEDVVHEPETVFRPGRSIRNSSLQKPQKLYWEK